MAFKKDGSQSHNGVKYNSSFLLETGVYQEFGL
jgi:hypothetical protein